MKPKKPTPIHYEPFTRPQSIAAIRDEYRAAMPDVDAMESFPIAPDAQPDVPPNHVIITDENGNRKIIRDGAEYHYLEDDDENENLPEDDQPTSYAYDTAGAFIIRAGDEWHAQNDDDMPADAMLFGPLWMQHELCIMFADTNVGKSILAVQIADSLSRGLPIPGFALNAPAAPVLYFDFELSEQQFRSRYSSPAHGKYPFTANFKRATLNPFATKHSRFASYEEFINNEIENALLATGAKALIIDNITCLRYGTQSAPGALNLMQYLQHIKRTYQISILVLAHTPKRNTTRPLSRNDLQGSKMLINLADSAFAIGESQQQPGLRYLKQIKQRSISEVHGAENVCLGRIVRTHNMLHFTFAGHAHENDHLSPQNEQYRRSTEHRIAQLNKQGHSVRQIAAKLGLASTTVFRALKRLERCADEGGCADVRICECADEEKAAAPCDSLPREGREGSPETEILHETISYADHPAAYIPVNPPMTNDQKECADMRICECADAQKAAATCDSLPREGREGSPETGTFHETMSYADHPAADIPANPPMTNDQKECADVRICECADEEKAAATCDSLPREGREGSPETGTFHETMSYADHPAADIPANPPMTNGDPTNDQKAPCGFLPGEGRKEASETEMLYETIIREGHKPPQAIEAAPKANDQNAAQVLQPSPITNDQMEEYWEHRSLYELPIYADHQHTQVPQQPLISNDYAANDQIHGSEAFPELRPLFEPGFHAGRQASPPTNNPIINDSMTDGKREIIRIITCNSPKKSRRSQKSPAASRRSSTHNAQPANHQTTAGALMNNDHATNDNTLSISDEIEGLTYLAKYEPKLFTPADAERLWMLRKTGGGYRVIDHNK